MLLQAARHHCSAAVAGAKRSRGAAKLCTAAGSICVVADHPKCTVQADMLAPRDPAVEPGFFKSSAA